MKIMESLCGGLKLKLKLFSENINIKQSESVTVNINPNIGDTHNHFSEGDKITDLRQKVETFDAFFRKLNKATISDDIENVIKHFNHAEAYYDKIKESHKYHEFVKEFPRTVQSEFYEFLISYYESIGLGHSTKPYKEKLEQIKSSS